MRYLFERILLLICLLVWSSRAVFAQATLPNGSGATNTNKDTSKSNTNKWKDEDATITFERLNSLKINTMDSSLLTFQRSPFLGDWGRDLGNLGSPVNNLFFTPENRVGPSFGYHVSDPYRFNVDSLKYYTTNRAYSVFSYQLGSKLEQAASIMHSQNIKPNWNMTVEYRKINSPGFYQIQRNNHDNVYLSTNYKSLDKHYTLYAGMVYNKIQHDENGGIIDATQLIDPIYTDRRTVDVAYENSAYSILRSSVSNIQRDFTFLLQHSYTWGESDTTYNADSTQFHYKLKPRVSITHKLEISTEKHVYNDLAPDSARYITLFNHSFASNNSSYYTPGEDSVFMQQNWVWIENKLMVNGFMGKEGSPLEFSAGVGNRFDEFTTQPVPNLIHDSLPDTSYSFGLDRNIIISNYVEGRIKKEALHPGEWEYGADAKFFLTGDDAGNFLIHAAVGKELKDGLGSFVAGFRQEVNSTPYNYQIYENRFGHLFNSFKPENVNTLYASIESAKLRLSGGVNNYVIGNYIYLNEQEVPAQYNIPFTISQAWVRKVFRIGNIFLDNQLAYQQLPENAPVNVPAVMGRHQLSYERSLFRRALKVEVGLEVRYNTAYKPAGYDALLNRFFYQSTVYAANNPEGSIFVNFRVKRFRAFVICDNFQQLFFQNTILYTGTPVYNFNNSGQINTPVYASPDLLIRFGFSWPLVN